MTQTFGQQLTKERAQSLADAGLWQGRLPCEYLDEIATSNPTAIAIVDHNSMTGERSEITYGELQTYSIRLACALRELGIQPGDVVSVQLPNWWHFAAVYNACVRIGAVINPLMPIFRERELEYMLGFAKSRLLVVPRMFRSFDYPQMIAGLKPALPELRHLVVVGGRDDELTFESLIEREWESEINVETEFQDSLPKPDDVTEIMYTSGTTGQPKGVMHTANTLTCKALLASELFSIDKSDSIFMGSPLAHQTGFMYAMLLSIYNGIKCVLQDIWEPHAAIDAIVSEQCTLTLGSTPFLSDVVNVVENSNQSVDCLRLFLCAGAPIPSALVEQAQRVLPAMYVMSAWGMTEMGIATATYPGDSPDKVINSDGRALPANEVRVVDDAGEPVAAGVEGRLQSRGASHFVGYLRRPEAYAVDADGWLETGDNATMDDDGYIRITGRSKDIIIRGGENVPVVEIEELLYRHPAVSEVAIVAMPDPRLGERGCAFVTIHDGAELDFDGMVSYLVDCKVSKQYLPERLEVITTFPRTASGKIQKFKLREIASDLTPQRFGVAK